MYFKEFLTIAFAVILLPVIDIPPYSLFIVGAFAVIVSLVALLKHSAHVSSGAVSNSLIWLSLAAAGLSVSWLLGLLDRPRLSEEFFNYSIRIAAIFLIFFLFSIIREITPAAVSIRVFADHLLWFVLVAAVFEFCAKYMGFENVLAYYKARQNLGGIDTIHFNRFSGFWSFPGDAAAIIVIAICTNYVANVNRQVIKNGVLLILLLFTQSKAGVAFLLAFVALKILRRFSLNFFLASTISAVVMIYLFSIVEFEYLTRFVNEFDWYLMSSKRSQEYYLYVQSTVWEQLLGLRVPFEMYESEVIGTLSRVGVFGSFWLLSIIGITIYFSIVSKEQTDLWLLLLAFVVVYCSISAGLSRYKVSLVFFILFYLALYYEIREIKAGRRSKIASLSLRHRII